jgi:psp operon transcriptional activator
MNSPIHQEWCKKSYLRVIEYGEFERVGGSRSVKVDVRLVAATNEDLPALADSGEFRADLLDRLAFDVITLPPLRERREDIMMLAENFAINMARELDMELFSGFTEKAKRTLLDYYWPGNIRELKNVVERAVYRSNNPNLPVHNIVLDPFESIYRPQKRIKTQDRIMQTEVVSSAVTPAEPLPQGPITTELKSNSAFDFPVDLKELSQDFEIDLINQALAESQFNQKKTAEKLGLTYHQLRGYLKKYNLLEQTNEDMD